MTNDQRTPIEQISFENTRKKRLDWIMNVQVDNTRAQKSNEYLPEDRMQSPRLIKCLPSPFKLQQE